MASVSSSVTDVAGRTGQGCYSLAASLPVEIVSEVLRYLSLGDRRRSRLVNRRWYEGSISKSIQLMEKFTVDGAGKANDRPLELREMIQRTSRRFLDVEFYRIDSWEHYPVSFWQDHGAKFHSLRFVQCRISKELFAHVVSNCSRLQHMTLDFGSEPFIPFQTIGRLMLPVYNDISFPCTVTNSSLQSLEIALEGMGPSPLELSNQLASVFPHVTKFSFSYRSLTRFSSQFSFANALAPAPALVPAHIPAPAPNPVCPTCQKFSSAMLNRLSLANRQVQSWKVNYPCGCRDSSMDTMMLLISEQPRLTELSLDVGAVNYRHLLKYLVSKPRLQILELRLNTSAEKECPKLGTDLLRIAATSCPRLFSFKIKQCMQTFWTEEIFSRLAVSAIRDLEFESAGHICESSPQSVVKYPLQKLTIRSLPHCRPSGLNKMTINILLNLFRKLEYLCLGSADSSLLQTIFRCQTNLRSLRILGSEEDTGSVPLMYSVANLHKLEELVVHSSLPCLWAECSCAPSTIDVLPLPNLRTLCVGTTDSLDKVLRLLISMPKLETAVIRFSRGSDRWQPWPPLYLASIRTLAVRLKRLTCFKVYGDVEPAYRTEELDHLYRTFPTLRYFVCGNRYSDAVTGKIRATTYSDLVDVNDILAAGPGIGFKDLYSILKKVFNLSSRNLDFTFV